MQNVADLIEQFIIQELFAGEEDAVDVKRSQLAEKLCCAPSQITYALTTRFTPEKGYEVESKRGNGGFIRIIRLPRPQHPQPNALPPVKKIESSVDLVDALRASRLITRREERLLRYFLDVIGDHATREEKMQMVREGYHAMEEEKQRG